MIDDCITIQLVDDHEMVRSGFRRLLEDEKHMKVVVESESGEQAWRDYNDYKPDIVLMDISMPGIGGIEAIKRILCRDSDARIVVLSMYSDEVASRVIEMGVKGLVNKSSAARTLIKAVETVMKGRLYIDGETAGYVLQEQKLENNPFDTLSKREFEILMHMLNDMGNNEIARIMGLSPKTVHTHKTNIMQKINAPSLVTLTRLAMHHGLIKVL